jgi:hypothetical protein
MLHSKKLMSIKMLIDSSHGIYRGENPALGKDVHGELDPTPGIREQPRPKAELAMASNYLPLTSLERASVVSSFDMNSSARLQA